MQLSTEKCPHTGKPLKPVSWSDAFRISDEGVIYNLKAESLSYDSDYFLKDYAQQYGRTYIEDEENIRRVSVRRLKLLLKYINKFNLKSNNFPGSFRLFEAGCAAGFFLDEARKEGFMTEGAEISRFACDYATGRMNLKVYNDDFINFAENKSGLYDAAAAFFVLEHIPDQRRAFELISGILKPGGFFLFALPSTKGPVFQCSRKEWVRTHPADHFADYSPDSLRKILPYYGLKLLHIQPSSYHPDRSCGWRKLLKNNYIYSLISDLTEYGDTMEGLAVRVK